MGAGEVADATNVLVLASGEETPAPVPPAAFDPSVEEPFVLLVTCSRPPAALLSPLRRTVGRPASTRVVAVGDGVRSAAEGSTGAAAAPDADGPVATVEHPADFTELGIRVRRAMEAWDGEGPLLVSVDSLTALLEHASVERTFRFLHVLTGQLSGTADTAQFYLDPAVDDRSLATLRPLFDAVLRRDGETWVTV